MILMKQKIYTEQSWSGQYCNNDENAFIFSLINKLNKPLKMKCIRPESAIYCSLNLGPNFGLSDFEIDNNSNINSDSKSNLGESYKHPDYDYGSNEAKSFLAGSYNFKVLEIEVYTKH